MKSLRLFCFLFCCAATFVSAQNTPKKPATLPFVADYAQLLQAQEREILHRQLFDYQQATNTQILLVIVDSLANASANDYATKIYKTWGLGTQNRDYAALLLVAQKENEIHIAAGQALENSLPEKLIHNIIADDIRPKFLQNKQFLGIELGLHRLMLAISPDFPVSPSPQLAKLQAEAAELQRKAQIQIDKQAETEQAAASKNYIIQPILHFVAYLLLYIIVIFASFKIWSPAAWGDAQHTGYQSKWLKKTVLNGAVFLLIPLILEYFYVLPEAVIRVGFAALLMANGYIFVKRLAPKEEFKIAYRNLYIYQSLLLATLLFLWFAPQQSLHINAIALLVILAIWRSAYLNPNTIKRTSNPNKSKTYSSNTPKTSYSNYKDYSNNTSSYSDASSGYSDYSDSSFGGGDTGGGGASGSW